MGDTVALQGFKSATKGMRRRLVICTEALEKKGKTHFGLTMPGPIALFDMDRGLEGVVDKFVDQKQILVADYRGMVQRAGDMKALYEARWKKFNEDYERALDAPLDKVRSVLLDTGTELWEYARLGVLGKLTQVPPLFYPEVNSQFRKIVDLALDHDKNVLITHKMKKEYTRRGDDDKGNWTGKYERAGFGEMGNLVQVILRHGRYKGAEDGNGDFYVDVVECRQNPDIVGDRYEGEMCTFPMLATMVLPNTNLEDWE